MSNDLSFTTPVGRIVGGNVYVGKDTDYEGNPLVYKSGLKIGQARKDFSIGVAFAKTPGAQHWSQELWLAQIWNLAHAAFPGGEASRRDFSFKIIDGDSTEPNMKMKRPCDAEGQPGHWIIWFSASQQPQVFNGNGSMMITEPGAVKCGYYVQVQTRVHDNKPGKTPGLYWDLFRIALAGYGPEITTGPDVASAGFGQGVALPAGASATPPAGAIGAPPPPPGAAPAPAPLIPGMIHPVGAPPAPNLLSASLPVPGGVSPAYAPSVRVMTPKAGSNTYEAFQVGAPGSPWTDALLVQEGYMYPPTAPVPVPNPMVLAGSVPVPLAVAPIAVVPNPAFTQMVPNAAPAMLAAPLMPPPALAAPSPVGPSVTAKAGGMTYAQLIAMPGWTDALLRQEGYIL